MSRPLAGLVAACLLACPPLPSHGQPPSVTPIRAEVLVKLAAHQRQLNWGAADSLRILVIGPHDDAAALAAQIAAQAERIPLPRPLAVHSAGGRDSLAWSRSRRHALVLTPGSRPDLAALQSFCRRTQTLAIATEAVQFGSGVMAAVLERPDDSARIAIHPEALAEAGIAFPADLLQLVRFADSAGDRSP